MKRRLVDFAVSSYSESWAAIRTGQMAAPGRVRLTDYSEVMRHIKLVDNGV
ncbi:hypothetical protein [Mycetohabitans sp. B46]|uniref:hypothetical protein n=1 Tax=Mycetohabitans sp. B46 TaxID=2772536 RepID=UPI00307F0739